MILEKLLLENSEMVLEKYSEKSKYKTLIVYEIIFQKFKMLLKKYSSKADVSLRKKYGKNPNDP